MADDARAPVYEDLHAHQLVGQEARNRASAHRILPLLFERHRPASLLDVGCGLGTWLSVARELGVGDLQGVDGPWLQPELSRFPVEHIRVLDLEQSFDLGRRFDLVVCLEVAEHLSPEAAPGFVASLARHADVVLFSAAIPHQGGHHHVNERFPEYWRDLFAAEGCVALDFLRPRVWTDEAVLPWLRQNLLVFARRELARDGGPFAGLEAKEPLALVHPEMYLARLQALEPVAQEHSLLMQHLLAGRTVSASRNPDGAVVLHVAGPART